MQNSNPGRPWQVRQTKLEIDLGRLKQNFFTLKKTAGSADLMVLLKSDAYGHSHEFVSRVLDDLPGNSGLHGFAVANLEEGIELRRNKIQKPVYVLSGVQAFDDDIYRCLHTCTLIPVLSSMRVLRDLDRFCRNTQQAQSFHLECNTGMNRLGIDMCEAEEAMKILQNNSLLRLDGLMSHYAASEKPKSALTKLQTKNFRSIITKFRNQGFTPRFIHMANSSGLKEHCFPEGNIARVGLHLYGEGSKHVKPVMHWSAQVYQIRDLKKGDPVGYGPLFRAKKKMRMAVLGVGYGDGYHRALSNRAEVIIHGVRCPVIGAVSMDLTAVDITKVPQVREDSRATLLGSNGKETITAVELAEHARCIPWEILTSISPRVPRIVVQ